jgi:small conductance mechanosensitive channel
MEFFTTDTGRLVAMIGIIILTFIGSHVLVKLLKWVYGKIHGRHNITPGGFYLFAVVLRVIIMLVGISYAISFEPRLKSLSMSFLASAGVATAIIGLSAKATLSNMVSGFVILVTRPFSILDWINVGDKHEGTVEEIKLQYTVIRDVNFRRLIIPNAEILGSYIINSTFRDEHILEFVDFGISYDSDIQKAKKIIQEVAEAHALSLDKRTLKQKKENVPQVELRLMNFGDFAITLRALVWVKDATDARKMRWVLNEKVKEQFDKEGIEIPFPYHNIIVKNEDTVNENSEHKK